MFVCETCKRIGTQYLSIVCILCRGISSNQCYLLDIVIEGVPCIYSYISLVSSQIIF